MRRGHKVGKKQRTIERRQKFDKAAFIKKCKEVGSVDGSVAAFWRSRATIYRWKNEDPAFANECAEAIRACYGGLRTCMMQRAKTTSDTLAIFLAKGRWPSEFREKIRIEILNDPGVKQLIQAVLQVISEFVPQEKLKDAAARLASLTNYQGRTEPGRVSLNGEVTGLPDPAGD